jgi:hypothetical protein
MEKGDLGLWSRPRIVVVIEGVLARVTPITRSRRFRSDEVTGYNAIWHDVPTKRLLYMKDRWPNVGQDLVTFISQDFCDQAAQYLDDIGFQFDEIQFRSLSDFTATLRYRQDIHSVYDSDPARLDRYGQLGHAVVPGEDF